MEMEFGNIYAVAVVLIPIITQYIKDKINPRLWAVIPFALGAVVAWIWGSTEGVQMQELLAQACAIGGGATLTYGIAAKTIAPALSTGTVKKK